MSSIALFNALFKSLFFGKTEICVRLVDYRTGKLKHRFLAIVEKKERGAKGQFWCFAEALASIYPKEREISPQNVIEFLKKFHINNPLFQTGKRAGK